MSDKRDKLGESDLGNQIFTLISRHTVDIPGVFTDLHSWCFRVFSFSHNQHLVKCGGEDKQGGFCAKTVRYKGWHQTVLL